MSQLPHHLLRIWLVLSLLVLPLDASLAATALDDTGPEMMPGMTPGMMSEMMHSSADDNASMDHHSMNHQAMDHQAMELGDKCPCQNKHCGDGNCGGMSHCANGHCSVVVLPVVSQQGVSSSVSELIHFSLASVHTPVFPPAHRPPIFSLV